MEPSMDTPNVAAQKKRERRQAREAAAKLAAQQHTVKVRYGNQEEKAEVKEPEIKFNNDIPHIRKLR